MIEGLAPSTLLMAFTTAILFTAGRSRISARVWRIPLVVVPGAIAAWLTGQLEPASPASLITAASLVVALASPREWWAAGAAAFGSLVVGTVVYAAYLVGVTVALTDSPVGLLLGLVLLAIEFAALALMTAAVFEVVDSLCRPLMVQMVPSAPAVWPVVCLQVPAHQEPPDLVIETIRSLVGLDYPRDRLVVQVLDNNTTDADLWQPLAAECNRLRDAGHRVEFVHLEDWPGFKSGALNWGRTHLPDDVEVVGVVDADYVVDPAYLKATVPYFADPTVAFVQTPQDYRDWGDSAFYRACHTGFEYFFRVGMVSRAYRNSIIFAGTMGLIRRLDLDAIGGWDEEIITEDAEASLRILGGGGRGIFVPQAYGRGIMPLTYEALRKQRFRWAFGGVQILKKHWRSLTPWSRTRLSQRQRRDYLLGGLWWFNDGLTLLFTAFVMATALGVATRHPFVVQRLWGLGIILPLFYIVLGLTRYVWGIRVATGVAVREAFDAMRVNLSLSFVVTVACVRALIEQHGVFLRTPKFRGSAIAHELRVVIWETILAGMSVLLGVWAIAVAGLSLLSLTIGVLAAWSVLIYGSATLFAIGDPTRPPAAMRSKAQARARGRRRPVAARAAAAGERDARHGRGGGPDRGRDRIRGGSHGSDRPAPGGGRQPAGRNRQPDAGARHVGGAIVLTGPVEPGGRRADTRCVTHPGTVGRSHANSGAVGRWFAASGDIGDAHAPPGGHACPHADPGCHACPNSAADTGGAMTGRRARPPSGGRGHRAAGAARAQPAARTLGAAGRSGATTWDDQGLARPGSRRRAPRMAAAPATATSPATSLRWSDSSSAGDQPRSRSSNGPWAPRSVTSSSG